MKDRILQFFNSENISATKFADDIGVLRSSVSHILSGRNKPSYDFILKILIKYPELNAEWLITGKGTMYKDVQDSNALNNSKELNLFNVDADAEINKKEEKKYSVNKDELITKKIEPVVYKSRNTVKIVYFYDDGTFKEYFPSEE